MWIYKFADVIKITYRPVIVFFITLLLFACGTPNKQTVSQDFNGVFLKEVGNALRPIILSIGPGEGNFESVYEHIKFNVVADEDIAIKEGWFAGVSLRKGQMLYGGEVVILYQKTGSQWKMTWYDLQRKPSQHPVNSSSSTQEKKGPD